MAQRDQSSPALFELAGTTGGTTNTGTSAAFVPPVGALLVVNISANRQSGAGATSYAITTQTGSTSAWTILDQQDGSTGGACCVAYATVLTSVSTTVQVVASNLGSQPSSDSDQGHVYLDVWVGTSGLGTTTTKGQSTTTTINPTLTTSAANSKVIAIASEYANGSDPTSTDTFTTKNSLNFGGALIRAHKNAPTVPSGTSVSINLTATQTPPKWSYILYEVKDGAGLTGYGGGSSGRGENVESVWVRNKAGRGATGRLVKKDAAGTHASVLADWYFGQAAVNLVYRGNNWAAFYKGVRSDASLYRGVRTLH
jgi:hypothetical protein